MLEFQYILCCGSTISVMFNAFSVLIFQYILCCGSTKFPSPFVPTYLEFQYILCCGSTFLVIRVGTKLSEFQYILCCGSTLYFLYPTFASVYFNTSYVAVQHDTGKLHRKTMGISIHLMLRFNHLELQRMKNK